MKLTPAVTLATITASAALALTASATTLAPTRSAAHVAVAPRDSTRTFVTHDTGQLAMADIADPQDGQPGIGDILAFTQRLTRQGHTVGRVSNTAIGVDGRRHLFQSNGTMQLSDGDITFAGLVPQTSRFQLAVTGGTGAYRDARGTLEFHLDGSRQLLTLRLR